MGARGISSGRETRDEGEREKRRKLNVRLELLSYTIEITLEIPVWTFGSDVEEILT